MKAARPRVAWRRQRRRRGYPAAGPVARPVLLGRCWRIQGRRRGGLEPRNGEIRSKRARRRRSDQSLIRTIATDRSAGDRV